MDRWIDTKIDTHMEGHDGILRVIWLPARLTQRVMRLPRVYFCKCTARVSRASTWERDCRTWKRDFRSHHKNTLANLVHARTIYTHVVGQQQPHYKKLMKRNHRRDCRPGADASRKPTLARSCSSASYSRNSVYEAGWCANSTIKFCTSSDNG